MNLRMQGCASSVKRLVIGVPGVKSVDSSVEAQSVTVVTDDGVTFEAISQAIQASGKEVQGGEVISDGEENKAN